MSESIVLNLDGKWKLRDFTPGQGLAAGAHLPDHDDTNRHRASVPGDVHMALLEIGRLEENETNRRNYALRLLRR
jgi:hypothetical protein